MQITRPLSPPRLLPFRAYTSRVGLHTHVDTRPVGRSTDGKMGQGLFPSSSVTRSAGLSRARARRRRDGEERERERDSDFMSRHDTMCRGLCSFSGITRSPCSLAGLRLLWEDGAHTRKQKLRAARKQRRRERRSKSSQSVLDEIEESNVFITRTRCVQPLTVGYSFLPELESSA